jgi:serine/threonine-protein kinase
MIRTGAVEKKPTSFGRYVVERELGRGAMGVVYLAEDPAIGRKVAIKTIPLEAIGLESDQSTLRLRLLKEARSAGILSHAGIVTVYDVQEQDAMACIIMEFVDGTTLQHRMSAGKLPVTEIIDLLDQTATALDYAHSKNVLHRDIKPANIMVTTSGATKIADFGVAKLTDAGTATKTAVVGTPSYMAPEQVASKPLFAATDQFSFAVLAFEMLAGRKPFEADSVSALLFQIVYQPPAPLRESNPGIPADVEKVLKKALSKEPKDRYASCSEFVKALRAACGVKPPPEPIVAAKERKPLWKPLAGVVAVLAIAAFVSAILILKPVQTSPTSEKGAPQEQIVDTSVPPSDPPKSTPSQPAPTQSSAPSSPTARPDRPPRAAPVSISSIPAEAALFVNEAPCSNPCQAELPYGPHRARAILEGYRIAYRSFEVSGPLEIRIPMEKAVGVLDVRGPNGAVIYVDGAAWKEPAPARIELPAGKYRFRLEINGVKTTERELTVEDGQTLHIN